MKSFAPLFYYYFIVIVTLKLSGALYVCVAAAVRDCELWSMYSSHMKSNGDSHICIEV